MATRWIAECDFCGKQETRGESLFFEDTFKDDTWVSLRARFGENDTVSLHIEACAPCGKKLEEALRQVFPEKYFKKNEED